MLRAQRDLAGARVYHERALAISERVLGPDHPHTAVSVINVGVVLHDQRDLVPAHSYWERALAIRERVLGPDHPDTLLVRRNLKSLRN